MDRREWDIESRACKPWDIERHKRRVGWFHWFILLLGITLMVYGMSHDAVVQEVPVSDGALIQYLQAERDRYRKERDDYRQLSAQLKAMVKAENARLAKLEEEYRSLAHSSLPSQPVILEAVRKEASTPAGFDALVKRTFGPIKVRVIQ